MKYRNIRLLILVSCISYIETTKWLAYSPGFNDRSAWEKEELPCPGDEVVFPHNYAAVLTLPKQVDIAGFILPHEGALLINQDSIINIGGEGDGEHKRHCGNSRGEQVYLKQPPISKWFKPDSWRLSSENNALPHMEKVPCNNDTIIINSGSLAIDMENVPLLRVGEFSLAGAAISRNYLQQLISNSDIGSILFKNTNAMLVEFYRNDVCGCHRDIEDFVQPICHNVESNCNRPHCLTPVIPFGSCCPICGAVLRFTTDTCDDMKLHKLRNLIEEQVRQRKLANKIDYHISYVNSKMIGNTLQAIVVDHDGYSKYSVNFITDLNATTNWFTFFKTNIHSFKVQVAGRPYNPNITFFSIILIILCVLFVGVVALIIFTHYAPNHPYLNRLPETWRNLILRSHFVFARFDNLTSADDGGAHDGNTSRRDNSMVIRYSECTDSRRERAFDNPLFKDATTASTSTATVVTAEVSNNNMNESSAIQLQPKVDTIKINDESEDKELEGLTDIKLETITAKSNYDDDEQSE